MSGAQTLQVARTWEVQPDFDAFSQTLHGEQIHQGLELRPQVKLVRSQRHLPSLNLRRYLAQNVIKCNRQY